MDDNRIGQDILPASDSDRQLVIPLKSRK